jgi:hypothetical protein
VSCLRFKPGTSETEVTNVTFGANLLNATIIIKYEPRGGRQESFCSVGGICISQYYEIGRWFLS